MMDFVDEIESYSPQTGQQPNANPYQAQPNPNPYKPNPFDFHLEQPSGDSSSEPNPKLEESPEKEEKDDKESGCTRFCKKKYYEQFFKVSEKDVLERIRASVVPPFTEEFVEVIRPTPDFYGPFWIMVTMVFLLGMVGNFANYIESKFSNDAKWEEYFFQLELVRHGMIVVFTMGVGVPLTLFALFKLMKINDLTFPEVVCVYGYSLVCYIPALLLCIIPFGAVQWIALIYALCNSSLFLWLSLKKHVGGAKQLVVFVLLAALQVTLFLLCRLLFFGQPQSKILPTPDPQPDLPANGP